MNRSISAHADISLVKIIIAQPKQISSPLHSWRQRVGDPKRNGICRTVQSISFLPILVKSGSQTEREFFTAAAPLHCFGSDVPIVLTSLQEKGESLMGQARDVGQVIHCLPAQATNVFFRAPCCVGSCIIMQEQNPSRLIANLAVL
ncbi:hypothetical protein AVEN_141710-1 [Araneus ventricosus]|uniref:Uncharacterized protein n=1 Tax=Araneus ventricosus TaxID=182803 RepID=A0A4Y2SK07_ARAVE|nr:hypothetical protein AVEN_97265-1 [Araneus ventricosus]GBN88237.1 hypothetical protein AVEN_141710-1 [Araneus ventricosus]